ncbi:MAG: hypothetical protein NC403_08770 [Muribaculaceae bacterium]|nr:hypothetical protein [Muribaculaceae bacterium]
MPEPLKTLTPGQVFWTFDHRNPEAAKVRHDKQREYFFYKDNPQILRLHRYELAAGHLYATEAEAEQARQIMILKMRYSRDMNNLTCRSCIFYCMDGDDIGTCTVSDNIVEPQQEACSNYQSDNTDGM